MKGVFWFLLIVLAFLFGLLIFNFTRQRVNQAGLVVFEVTAESIQAFERRVAELESSAVVLRNRLSSSALIERVFLNRRLNYLEGQIRDLKAALAQWRASKDVKSAADIYRQCLLLYGKASGVCDLLANDTLPPAEKVR